MSEDTWARLSWRMLVTAPGQRFETGTRVVNGVEQIVFVNSPPSLRELWASARARGDSTFLVYEDERWSFADFMAKVDGLAAALVHRYGIVKGDRVAIGMRNYPEWVVAFAAITSIGAISVSLNAWWSEDELDFALEDCEKAHAVLVADKERVERCAAASRVRPAGHRHRLPGAGRAGRQRPVPMLGTTSWSTGRRCPTSWSTPTTTPRSSTRRARPAGRRARCRPIGRSSRPCSASAAGPSSTRSAGPRSRTTAATRPRTS